MIVVVVVFIVVVVVVVVIVVGGVKLLREIPSKIPITRNIKAKGII